MIRRELVLVGAGAAHLVALRRFAMRPLPADTRVTLVVPEAEQPYSGLVPAVIAGGVETALAVVTRLGHGAPVTLLGEVPPRLGEAAAAAGSSADISISSGASGARRRGASASSTTPPATLRGGDGSRSTKRARTGRSRTAEEPQRLSPPQGARR